MPKFSHLHVHSQYSLLDGAADIPSMFTKAVKDGMPGLAITDHGNMFGAFQFVNEAEKINAKARSTVIKPIVGCEFYVVEDRHKKSFTRPARDNRYHQLLLAKNAIGYKNLVKLCSLGFIEGMYSKYPRIDKELILQYHEGLIATTCCLAAEVPRTILRKGEEEGEKVFQWWLELFGEDYYIEIQRHGIPDQEKVNKILQRFSEKYNVKIIASNDSHYVEQEDFNAHDILLCINTGEKKSTPALRDYNDDDEALTKGTRFAFFNDQFFLKKTSEMEAIFHDIPVAIDNTNEIVSKVEIFSLKKDIMLPNFVIPPEFRIHTEGIDTGQKVIDADSLNQWEYLKAITYEGANARYGVLSQELRDRIDFELQTIHDMGFAGYFLIVSDFIKAGREMGVYIGPGRGSAAGSVVAYSIGVTNIEPLRYNLLFERFLNPERISLPDIDTDFDDAGRQKVIDYVVNKYGQNQVAQIVTFGTMAAKMSIKDVARVLELSIPDSNALTKLVPDRPGISLKRVLHAPITNRDAGKEGEKSLESADGISTDDQENVKKIREIYNYSGNDTLQSLRSEVLKQAEVCEGSIRGTGVHAAGLIIAPKDLTEIIPVCTAKDSPLWLTQFEGGIIEDAGVIKMDFLGLKNLTILKDCLQMIEENHAIRIDLDHLPLDDMPTLELFQRGETVGVFQFESTGMQQWLKQLKPDKFEDLIAMNALYRPGPMEYIPNYVARKHGRETVKYDLPEMEEILAETYGITVYQEQVMLLSQKLAGFSKGKADELRKAMGKKLRDKLDKAKPEFLEGGKSKGLPVDKLEKIWCDWEAFASYAFNKSHSTCYAIVAYQTAFLKVHYSAEYMAAVLTHNLSNIEDVSFYIDECRHMGLKILPPDVNESGLNFTVNKSGEIRFGLQAIKGFGESAAESIIIERKKSGQYTGIFDLVKRINMRSVNRKSFESLAMAGAFDSFPDTHRAIYFYREPNEEMTFLDKLLRYGNAYQAGKSSPQVSLFGDSIEMDIPSLKIPICEPWPNIVQLRQEKETIGLFMSGHPLDDYSEVIKTCTNMPVKQLKNDMAAYKDKEFNIAGIITDAQVGLVTKTGNSWGKFTIEDFDASLQISLFSEDYLKFKHFLVPETPILLRIRVAARFSNAEQLDIKVINMTLLSEAIDKLAKQISIHVPAEIITPDLANEITSIVTNNAGGCKLRVIINDSNNKMSLDLLSGKFKVKCSTFMKAIKTMPAIGYSISTH